MTDELEKFIEICDCKKIREVFADKINCRHKGINDFNGLCLLMSNDSKQKCSVADCRKIKPYLPTIDQLIEMVGDRFATLKLLGDHWMASYWTGDDKHTDTTKRVNGQSARIALATAAKQILTERSGG